MKTTVYIKTCRQPLSDKEREEKKRKKEAKTPTEPEIGEGQEGTPKRGREEKRQQMS